MTVVKVGRHFLVLFIGQIQSANPSVKHRVSNNNDLFFLNIKKNSDTGFRRTGVKFSFGPFLHTAHIYDTVMLIFVMLEMDNPSHLFL